MRFFVSDFCGTMEWTLSHGEQQTKPGTTGKPPANHRPAGPTDYDFTPKPLPNGHQFARVIGLIKDENPDGSLKPGVQSQVGTIPGITPGPTWQRGPLQEPMGPSPFPKATGHRNRRLADEAQVRQAVKDMTTGFAGDNFASQDTGPTPNGRRMVVVDEAFYAKNHRPKPIREGAGKGPRKLNHFPRFRC